MTDTPETDALIASLEAASGCKADSAVDAQVIDFLREKERQTASLARDAGRYRWLRDRADPDAGEPYVTRHVQNSWGNWRNTYECGETGLDALIDAARGSSGETATREE